MIAPTPDWADRVRNFGPGDHVLALSGEPEASGLLLRTYVEAALGRGDLVVIAVRRREYTDYLGLLRRQEMEIEQLIALERVAMLAADDWIPRSPSDRETPGSFFESAIALAESRQGRRLTFFGRLSGSLAEDGDLPRAEAIERALHDRRAAAPILCLIDTRRLSLSAFELASALVRHHTHTLTALGADRFFLESVPAHGASRGR